MKTISVCLATYNGSKYLKDQIDSILPQLCDLDELIVADDGSDDSTIEILNSYKTQLKIVASSRVGSPTINFERLLSHSSKQVIVLCDQDDVWLPGRIDLIRSSISECELLMLNGIVVDKNLKNQHIDIFQYVSMHSGFFKNFFKNTFVGCCLAFDREMLNFLLPFPKGLPCHDWYIGLVAEIYFNVKRIEQPTILFRRHDSNASNTGRVSNNLLHTKIYFRLLMSKSLLLVFSRRLL